MPETALIPYRREVAVEIVDDGDDIPISTRRQPDTGVLLSALRAALVAPPPPKIPDEDLPGLWASAFDEWLARSPRTGEPRPEATVKAYLAAWKDFNLFTQDKAPWRVTPGDVRAWLADLRSRPVTPHVARGLERNGRRAADQLGLSEGTVAQYLAAVSSFYSYASEYPVPLLDGREIPLFEDINPARARGIPRPRSDAFARATWLDAEQLDALVNAIRAYAASTAARNAKGLRDVALFTCYILTGGRNSEIRVWQWKDLRIQGGATYYHWRNKGKEGWDELPAPAWKAVRDFLKLSGRLASIQPNDYIFTSVTDRAQRLQRLSRLGDHAPKAIADGPLSGHEVGRLLKYYGKRAGLDPSELHVHVLRHSAYMLYTTGGADVRFCSKLLHHSSLAITTRYDHVMAGQRNTEWAKAAAQLPSLQSGLYEDTDDWDNVPYRLGQ